MSASLSIRALSGKNSSEFKKHLKSVMFCIENDLSYPKETSEFFKGKCGGDNLEDIKKEFILDYIQDGVEIPLDTHRNLKTGETIIKVSEIPKEVDEIVVKISY